MASETFKNRTHDEVVAAFREAIRHDAFDRGRYTIKQTGEYFEGSFKNGDPDKGKWYDKNGKEM